MTPSMKEKHAANYARLQTVKRSNTGNEVVDAIQEWDRRMQRAFKGIYTRKHRLKGMQRAGF